MRETESVTEARANDALREELRAGLRELAELLLESPESTYRVLNSVRHLRVLTHLLILDEGRRAMVGGVLRELTGQVVNGGVRDPRALAARVGSVAAGL